MALQDAVRPVMDAGDPFRWQPTPGRLPQARWPADWVGPATAQDLPYVAGYRLTFEQAAAATTTVHVSGDEHYELYLDGELVGRGPDRGDLEHWRYHSYELDLSVGRHRLAALVWSVGADAAWAQISAGPAFLLASDDPALCTGRAAWEVAELPGYRLGTGRTAHCVDPRVEIDGRILPWGWQLGEDGLDWDPARVVDAACDRPNVVDVNSARLLVPTTLPPRATSAVDGLVVRHVARYEGRSTSAIVVTEQDRLPDEVSAWQALLDGTGSAVVVGPREQRRVIIDLDAYVCGRITLRLRDGRGATIAARWLESLMLADEEATGDRDAVDGKRFRSFRSEAAGIGDSFVAGGAECDYTGLDWSAGRYVELTVSTGRRPLEVLAVAVVEEHYPYVDASAFAASDPRWEQVHSLAFRTLQMCSHDTTMDCPYYERLQYAGDARIQCLAAYVCTGDDRLARQAMVALDHSRGTTGLTRSRYPAHARQTIPPFSLWWIAMVHDFALWRGDLGFVADRLPGIRTVLETHRRALDADGLFHALDGWNFTDWVPTWPIGQPPAGEPGRVSGILQLQLAHIAALAADLERWAGSARIAEDDDDLARTTLAAAERHFFDAASGRYADDLAHTAFSEHAQALALLAGAEHGSSALLSTLEAPDLARTTIYFDHYLFDAMARVGRTDVIMDRMSLWFGLTERGLRTVVESPEPCRSDCHAWSSHPLVHEVTALLGVRPTEPGMASVTVAPQLAGMQSLVRTVPTPAGPLRVAAEDGAPVRVSAPDGVRVTVA